MPIIRTRSSAVDAGTMSAVPHAFDVETELVATGDHTWTTELTANWNIGENPNGGYLLAPLLRAMQLSSGHPDPLSVTTHYLRPGQAGPAEISVEVVRVGRTIGTVRGRLSQGGVVKLESMAACTDLSDDTSIVDLDSPMPDIPPPDECVSRENLRQGVDLPLMDRLDVRIHPDHADHEPGGSPEISGWIRFKDQRPVDAASLTLFADAFPPPIFSMVGLIGWVPTIELTVQVRRRPVDGWILGHFKTMDGAGNRPIEDGSLWDTSGKLVAQSRQVGLILSARS